MRPERRSLMGFLLAALLVPLLAGVLACIPVPIGDPETSAIDPATTGIWIPEGDLGIWLMDRYDERTWLATVVEVDTAQDPECEALEAPVGYAEAIELMENHRDCLEVSDVGIFKAWSTELDGRRFLTLEPRGLISTEGDSPGSMEPPFWFVFEVEHGDGRLTLRPVDPDFDGFDGIPTTREAFEEVLTRHGGDEDLYDDAMALLRVRGEDAAPVGELLNRVLHRTF